MASHIAIPETISIGTGPTGKFLFKNNNRFIYITVTQTKTLRHTYRRYLWNGDKFSKILMMNVLENEIRTVTKGRILEIHPLKAKYTFFGNYYIKFADESDAVTAEEIDGRTIICQDKLYTIKIW